jgi:hypothetical protein
MYHDERMMLTRFFMIIATAVAIVIISVLFATGLRHEKEIKYPKKDGKSNERVLERRTPFGVEEGSYCYQPSPSESDRRE